MRFDLTPLEKRIVMAVAAAFLLVAAGFAVPFRSRSEIYRPVDAESAPYVVRQSPILTFAKPEQYLVERETLYLLVETQQGALIGNKRVARFAWASEDIARFRIENPALEAFWPNRREISGGVPWVGKGWQGWEIDGAP